VIRADVEHIWYAGTGSTFGAVAPIVLFIQVAAFDVEDVAQKRFRDVSSDIRFFDAPAPPRSRPPRLVLRTFFGRHAVRAAPPAREGGREKPRPAPDLWVGSGGKKAEESAFFSIFSEASAFFSIFLRPP
jgi:hypothetical protein